MRKVCVGLLLGFSAFACGGGEDTTAPPQPPPPPPVASMPATPPAASTASAPATPPKPSMAEMQQSTMKAITDAMNAHDSAKFAASFADDATVTWGGMPDQHGRADIAKVADQFYTAFKDLKFWVSRVWMKGDMVAVEWGWNGTNTGDFMGGKPTEKQAGTMGLSIDWFGEDGLIKKEDRYADMATVAAQLGMSKAKARAVPTPAASVEAHAAKGTPDEEKNVDLVKAIDASFEAKKEADFLAGLSDDVQWDDETMPDAMKGKDSAKKFFGMFTKAFPDMKFTIGATMGVEDFAIVESTMTGTQKGALGPLPPSKKPVSVHGVDIVQIKDGKAAHGWSYMNNAELLMQIGAMKPPAAAKPAADKGKTGAAGATGSAATGSSATGSSKSGGATKSGSDTTAAPKK